MAPKRELGTVKKITNNGFGFIERLGLDDIYFRTERLDHIREGDPVTFIINTREDGKTRAVDIKLDENAVRTEPEIKAMGRSTVTKFTFGPEYLKDGYFYEENGKKYLRAEQLDAWAIEIAKLFHNCGVNAHQFRRLFNRVRGIEARLMMDKDKDFDLVKADIYSLRPAVAYQVGRNVAPEVLQQFIDYNIPYATIDEQNFRKGFLVHFEAVLGYFVFYTPESSRSSRRS